MDHDLLWIIGGDTAAFARWLATAERPVRESLRSFATAIDTEAVLQEALLRVWQVAQVAPQILPDGRPHVLLRLGVWIARNLAISELRRRRPEPIEPDRLDDTVAAPTPAAPDPLLREAIRACREQLPPQPRRALDARLADAGARDDDDLARTVDMRRNTFLQNITRARRLLAKCLEQRGVALDVELAT